MSNPVDALIRQYMKNILNRPNGDLEQQVLEYRFNAIERRIAALEDRETSDDLREDIDSRLSTIHQRLSSLGRQINEIETPSHECAVSAAAFESLRRDVSVFRTEVEKLRKLETEGNTKGYNYDPSRVPQLLSRVDDMKELQTKVKEMEDTLNTRLDYFVATGSKVSEQNKQILGRLATAISTDLQRLADHMNENFDIVENRLDEAQAVTDKLKNL